MNISIKSIIGPRCIIKEDGQRIYDEIHDPLLNGEEITLDFAEVNQFASPFFNYAIGQLLNDIDEGTFRRLLHFENLDEAAELVVGRVIENASMSRNDNNYLEILNEILGRQAKDSD